MPKITSEDMDKVREAINHNSYNTEDQLIALANILVSIWDRGYAEGQSDAVCPFIHAHTRDWCGYAGCRES